MKYVVALSIIAAMASATLHANAMGTAQTWTPVTGPTMTALSYVTKSYFNNSLHHAKAFYTAVTPDYVYVTRNGKTHNAGTFVGLAKSKKLAASSITLSVSIVSAKQSGTHVSENVIGVEDENVIDSAGARQASTSYSHQLMLVRGNDGSFRVSRDIQS